MGPLEFSLLLQGKVVWVGSSSAEIHVELKDARNDNAWLCAQFVYVSRDIETLKATAMPSLTPETPPEISVFQEVFNTLFCTFFSFCPAVKFDAFFVW